MSKSGQTARQQTLTQMSQAMAIKAAQNQLSTGKRRASNSSNKGSQSNKKGQIHEVINLQKQGFGDFYSANIAQGKNQQAFVSQLAKKCGSFFNWINQVDYRIFSQQIWKNKMMLVVGQRFPQLNTEQQQKLIQRDWKIMSQQRRQEVMKEMMREIGYEEMNRMVNEEYERERWEIEGGKGRGQGRE